MKKYLLILTTLALLGGGCSKEEIPETTDGEGSVEFRTTTCSEVDSQTTRAQTSLPDNCKPSGNSFKLVVKGKEGTATAEYLAEYTTLSEYTAPFMPSGDYTATISYGDPQQEAARLSATRERSTLQYSPARRFKRPLPPRSRTR